MISRGISVCGAEATEWSPSSSLFFPSAPKYYWMRGHLGLRKLAFFRRFPRFFAEKVDYDMTGPIFFPQVGFPHFFLRWNGSTKGWIMLNLSLGRPSRIPRMNQFPFEEEANFLVLRGWNKFFSFPQLYFRLHASTVEISLYVQWKQKCFLQVFFSKLWLDAQWSNGLNKWYTKGPAVSAGIDGRANAALRDEREQWTPTPAEYPHDVPDRGPAVNELVATLTPSTVSGFVVHANLCILLCSLVT